MRALVTWIIVALLAGPASAADCAATNDSFYAARAMTEDLLGLVRGRMIDWGSVVVDPQTRPAYVQMQAATNALMEPLQHYLATSQAALPTVGLCALFGEDHSPDQLAMIETAQQASAALAQLLVEYLVAYDGLPTLAGR